jgi:hypothetical protein
VSDGPRRADHPGAEERRPAGSSRALPLVAAGVAAPIRSAHPNMPAGAVAALLRASASPLACPSSWPVLRTSRTSAVSGGQPGLNGSSVGCPRSNASFPAAATMTTPRCWA